MSNNNKYSADSIKSLDWKEHIRLRPGMYIGKLGNGSSVDDGIYIQIKEIIDNSNLNHDTLYCKSLARSKHPGYICKNPLMCTPEEVNIVINELTQYEAVFQNCMLKKGYNYN